MAQSAKRARMDNVTVMQHDRDRLQAPTATLPSLTDLLRVHEWEAVTRECRAHPERVMQAPDPSPLAIACRTGAPFATVQAILEACPAKLRLVLDSRGTPLHEAIVRDQRNGTAQDDADRCKVIEALLKADEALGKNDPTRATLLQDVDGFTPLHLLIRRRFQEHILRADENTALMEILEMLVRSCPEAVVIPDRGEYEEPPIVYALKANIYAPSLGSGDDTLARVERQIYEMVRTMLKHAPTAAAQVFSGFRGQYSALHSAVFHGRYTTTIDLLLQAEQQHRSVTAQKAALLTNTQSELPLHFCVMRGERPLTVALLSKAAPEAVQERDASGLTPFHWMWIRFVSTMCAIDGDRGTGVGGDTANSITLRINLQLPYLINRYNNFTAIEQGDFEADLRLIRRLDPPVDFLRMRHIPPELAESATSLQWATRAIQVLSRLRERFHSEGGDRTEHTWTRQETVVGLFWTKVVSLLQASATLGPVMPSGAATLVHTALVSPSCPPPVARLVATLFPQELRTIDDHGRLPIHYAASRSWHSWDWVRGDGVNGQAAARLLRGETLATMKLAMDMSPAGSMRVADRDNRLVLHIAIETLIQSCYRSAPRTTTEESSVKDILKLLHDLVTLNPESLHRREGITRLYPFMQATAVATAQQSQRIYGQSELPLSMTFALLRADPTVLSKY